MKKPAFLKENSDKFSTVIALIIRIKARLVRKASQCFCVRKYVYAQFSLRDTEYIKPAFFSLAEGVEFLFYTASRLRGMVYPCSVGRELQHADMGI